MKKEVGKIEGLQMMSNRVLDSINPRRLELIILPTEKCNLRCGYCYEDFKIGRIRPETVQGIKALIKKRAEDLLLLKLSWFGGEPLLASNEILDICHYANQQTKRNPNLRIISGMTTNGVLLTPDLAKKLDSVGVKQYQISLDGPQELHDKSRVTVNGKGSYDAIWQNLIALSRTKIQFHIVLRVHYQLSTWREVLPLLDLIKKEFGEDTRFEVLFKAILRLGGKNDESIVSLNAEQKINIEKELIERVKGRNAVENYKKIEYVEGNEKAESNVCYAAKANSLLIRANGRINKCTVALNDDSNDIGSINIDGTLSIDKGKLAPWLKGIETNSDFELGCPYASHIRMIAQGAQRTISIKSV